MCSHTSAGEAQDIARAELPKTLINSRQKKHPRRFPPPWIAERIPGSYVIEDAEGQALAYVYACESKKDVEA
jgi:hypothetical protein